MVTIVTSTANATGPLAINPSFEKDYAIVRGVTLALFDWSNPDCYSGAANADGGTVLNNLVAGGASAQISPANTIAKLPYQTGLFKGAGAVSAGGWPFINLPTSFNLGAAVTRALLSITSRVPSAGWNASGIRGLIGSGTGSGAALQYIAYVQADANGNALNLVFRVRGANGAQVDTVLTGAALAAILDSTHQLGFAFSIANGQGQGFIYVDGVLKATSAAATFTSFNQAGGTPTLFTGPGVSAAIVNNTLDVRIGRPTIHDLSARADLTFAGMLARGLEAATGYVA